MKKPVKTYEVFYGIEDTDVSAGVSLSDVARLMQRFYMCEYIDYYHHNK